MEVKVFHKSVLIINNDVYKKLGKVARTSLRAEKEFFQS